MRDLPRRIARGLIHESAVLSARWTARALSRWPAPAPERAVCDAFAGSGFHLLRGQEYAPVPGGAECPLAYLARRLEAVPGAEADRAFAEKGFHLVRRRYDAPVPDEADLSGDFQERRSAMPGVAMDDRGALELLETVFSRYTDEFRAAVPLERPAGAGPDAFHLINGTFMAVDAHVYYAFIRHGKPRRIVEIGGGNSSVLAGMACERNRAEDGRAPRLTVVEPYPGEALRNGFPGLSELVAGKVQDAPTSLFASLAAGDILFIDSSHVLRSGGDVQHEYLEILPRLAPGVLVHVHDISLPKPYPRVYFEQGLYWNEQYLLQAFLAFNSRFEVVWPGNYMILNYPDRVCAAFPEYHAMRREYPQSEPSSFWMRRRP